MVGGGATPPPVDDRQHLVEHCSTASTMTAFTALTVLHTGEGRQLGQLKATNVMQTEILNLQLHVCIKKDFHNLLRLLETNLMSGVIFL